MEEDIEAQLLERTLNSLWYPAQVDEFTNVETILVLMRYVFQENVQEDMLGAHFCQPTSHLETYSNLWMITYQEN